ncbi:hypothetical protein LIER_02094 [Lithospermum erythrorhizon]|uniref:Uncharacterized protein n=1 Tax=Lithospermum erythrorhizon TaxID=34254 RepID=A0AAV3NPI6_LITER
MKTDIEAHIKARHPPGLPHGTTDRATLHKQKEGNAEDRGNGYAGGSNENIVSRFQLQVDELNARLKDIAPTRGPMKHNTLLPFSYSLRH